MKLIRRAVVLTGVLLINLFPTNQANAALYFDGTVQNALYETELTVHSDYPIVQVAFGFNGVPSVCNPGIAYGGYDDGPYGILIDVDASRPAMPFTNGMDTISVYVENSMGEADSYTTTIQCGIEPPTHGGGDGDGPLHLNTFKLPEVPGLQPVALKSRHHMTLR